MLQYKPELLATAGSLEQVQKWIRAGADAVMVGEQTYGLRLPGDMGVEEIAEAVTFAHQNGAKVYVSVNNIFSNDSLKGLSDYIARISEIGADALVFGDPAVIMTLRQLGLKMPLHWNGEMTSTNFASAAYWAEKGAVRVVLARELNMNQVLEIKRKVPMEVEVQVHGMTNIYHSKRALVDSYLKYLNKVPGHTGPQRGLYLVEHERPDLRFPVFEDKNGTHVMSSEDLCMIENLHELMEGRIDSFRVECLLKPDEYNETVLRVYRKAVDAYVRDPDGYEFQPEWLEQIQRLQDPHRELTFGFFYKEQVY